MAQINVIKIYF